MSQFEIFDLEYSNHLIEHYQNFADLPGFVLLESTDTGQGRYDILTAYPYEIINIPYNAGQDEIQEGLKKLQFSYSKSESELPFQGGGIGYFSYDFAAVLYKIPIVPQLTLHTFPLMEFGLYDWAIITDHWLKKVSLFARNTKIETLPLVREMLSRWKQQGKTQGQFKLYRALTPLISKPHYQAAFNDIQRQLRQGRCYQVNFTQPFTTFYSGDSWAMYKKIRMNNPVPYAALMKMQSGDILSFSPERFLTMENQHVLTSPIKGSMRRSPEAVEDALHMKLLMNSSKNKAENIMIVDLLRNDLGKIAHVNTVKVTSLCEVQSYRHVHHLVSHIEAICRDEISLLDAFLHCFPGGSIVGAPKREAMRVIAEQEQFARGAYCGSIGYFSSHGRLDCNIAIRTLIARNETLHLAAGGGIVIDSTWEEEYNECFIKIAAIMEGLH